MPHRVLSVRVIIVTAAVLVLTIISSTGALDNCALKRVAETTEESIGIFALSRGTNAVISVAQSSQFGIGIASIQIGELLDPINDAVERLSSVMVWAIGSLFLQQIILEVASSSVFKWGFFVIGLAAISALLLVNWERFRNLFSEISGFSKANLEHYRDLLIRIFIAAAILRFIVPAFVTLSFLASPMLLGAKIKAHEENLSSLCKQVLIYPGVSSLEAQHLCEQKALKDSELGAPKKPKSTGLRESQNPDIEIKQLNEKTRSHQWLLGIPNTVWNKLSNVGKASYARLKEIFDKSSKASKEIVDKSKQMVKNITYLLIAIVIKNILLPLAFLAITIKCSLPIARYSMRLVSGLKRDSKELQGYLGRGD